MMWHANEVRLMNDWTCGQAAMEEERLALQDRLNDALDSRMVPCLHLDTSSPVDLTVNLLDGLLQVQPAFVMTASKDAMHS